MQIGVCGLQECKYVVLAQGVTVGFTYGASYSLLVGGSEMGVGSKEVRTKKLIIVEQNCDLSLFSSKIVINRPTRT
jgi:hypothetical protein